jgi:hypothetical protein
MLERSIDAKTKIRESDDLQEACTAAWEIKLPHAGLNPICGGSVPQSHVRASGVISGP